MKTAPLLSIGMIFKDEARCLERCLQSLQPLRDAIPCELVMADTGSSDGSRAIAERYADEVFDFPWIDDFAAARNAVMDRCRGKWYFTVDCDEWLDADISELIAFLTSKKKVYSAYVIQRSYNSPDLEQSDQYGDFFARRLVCMDTGVRYVGAIHEVLSETRPPAHLTRTILHHDGYLFVDSEAKKEKLERNMKLLRTRLERQPDSLRTLTQCIESCEDKQERLGYARRAVELVQAKRDEWSEWGACVMRHAVEIAHDQKLPEWREWIEYAFSQFADSIFIRVDGNYAAFMNACDAEEWEKAVLYGEGYRQGLQLLRAADHSQKTVLELGHSMVHYATLSAEYSLLVRLANACFQIKQYEKTLEILAALDGGKLDSTRLSIVITLLIQLHAHTSLDVQPTLAALYGQLSCEKQGKNERLAVFNQTAESTFTRAYCAQDETLPGYRRPAYTAFAALADKCEAGRAARMMMAETPAALREWLLQVEDWQALPIEALERALAAGVEFPLAEKPLPVEVLDGLAVKLTHGENLARQMALALPMNREKYPDLQSLRWGLALAMASVRAFDWTPGGEKAGEAARPDGPEGADERPGDTPETGLAILRAFARVEAAALPALYAPELLTEENAALLPPLHRWGLYSGRAFEALDAGRPQEYLAALRRGFAACPGQKDMARFLLDRFRQEARSEASPELLALAEKVRGILAAYGPEHPAAKALRESDAYKQVAWLIEETPGRPVQ